MAQHLSPEHTRQLQQPLTALTQMATTYPGSFDRLIATVWEPYSLAAFQQRHTLTPTKRKHACIWMVLGKRCRHDADLSCWPPSSDHVTMWDHAGTPACLVSQPYGLSGSALRAMTDFAQQHALELQIDADSWYFVGSTILVMWWHPERYRAAHGLMNHAS